MPSARNLLLFALLLGPGRHRFDELGDLSSLVDRHGRPTAEDDGKPWSEATFGPARTNLNKAVKDAFGVTEEFVGPLRVEGDHGGGRSFEIAAADRCEVGLWQSRRLAREADDLRTEADRLLADDLAGGTFPHVIGLARLSNGGAAAYRRWVEERLPRDEIEPPADEPGRPIVAVLAVLAAAVALGLVVLFRPWGGDDGVDPAGADIEGGERAAQFGDRCRSPQQSSVPVRGFPGIVADVDAVGIFSTREPWEDVGAQIAGVDLSRYQPFVMVALAETGMLFPQSQPDWEWGPLPVRDSMARYSASFGGPADAAYEVYLFLADGPAADELLSAPERQRNGYSPTDLPEGVWAVDCRAIGR